MSCEQARALHSVTFTNPHGPTVECRECGKPYPCRTLQALEEDAT